MKQWMRILILLYCALACYSPDTNAAQVEYRIGEPALRTAVSKSVTPRIPDGYRSTSPSVAVVEVELTEKGELLGVGVLEAPTPRIATELQKAVQQWRFGQVGSEPGRYRGKLTFYFVTIDGVTRVFGTNENLDESHRSSSLKE